MNVIELATLKDVPILKAGKHFCREDGSGKSGFLSIEETELDDTIEGSNELARLMSGGYQPPITLGKRKMPGPLTLLHDDILDDTIREKTRGVKTHFGKADGWVVEEFSDVPHDIAKTLLSHYPYRSVDLIPTWTHPETGKLYKNVVLSTAFLDRYTPPAVKGQNPHLLVEFSEGESPVTVLYSAITDKQPQEEDSMAHEQTTMPEPGKELVELTGKLSEKDKQIAELQAQRDTETARIAELEAAREADKAAIAELAQAQDAAEVREYLTGFKTQTLLGSNGGRFAVSPAFLELTSPLLAATRKQDVIEMSGETKPTREVVKTIMQKVVEMAANGALVMELGTSGSVPEQDAEKMTEKQQIDALLKENPSMTRKQAFLEVNATKDITRREG